MVLKRENKTQKHINFENSIKRIIEKIGKNENHQGCIDAVGEFNAPPKMSENKSSNCYTRCSNSWYDFGEIMKTSLEQKEWANAVKRGSQIETDSLNNEEVTYTDEVKS